MTEFDDLEMCTSLDCGSHWRPPSSCPLAEIPAPSPAPGEPSSLQGLVQDLRSQLSRSQAVIRGLLRPSVQEVPPQGGAEEDRGPPASSFLELVSRVEVLEDQLKGGAAQKVREDRKWDTWPG